MEIRIPDVHGTAEHGREMSGVLLCKAIRLATSMLDQENN
jgi:hypothetical protein